MSLKIRPLAKSEFEDFVVYGVVEGVGESAAVEEFFPIWRDPYLVFRLFEKLYGPPHSELLSEGSSAHDDLNRTMKDYVPFDWFYFFVISFEKRIAGATVYGDGSSVLLVVELFEPYSPDIKIVEELVQLFIDELDRGLKKYGGQWAAKDKKPRVFRIDNVYQLYFEGAHRLNQLMTPMLIDESSEVVADLVRAQFFLLMASFEGFVNLLHELYLRPELRDTPRSQGRIQRDPLDHKIASAVTHCVCFKEEAFPVKTEPFNRYLYLLKLRNDFIHANITSGMRAYFRRTSRYDFWSRTKYSGKYELPMTVAQLNHSHMDFVFETIEQMVELVLGHMKPRYRREFEAAIHQSQIGVEVVGNEYLIVS